MKMWMKMTWHIYIKKKNHMLRKQSKNTSIKLYQQGNSSNNHDGTKF